MDNEGSIKTLKGWIKQNEDRVSATNVEELKSRIVEIGEEINQAMRDRNAATQGLRDQIEALERQIKDTANPYDKKINDLEAISDGLSTENYRTEKAERMLQYHRKALEVLELQEKGYKIVECQAVMGYKGFHKVGTVVRGTNFQGHKYMLVKEITMTRAGIFLTNNVAKTPRKIATLDGVGIGTHTYPWTRVLMVKGPLVTKTVETRTKRSYDDPDAFEIVYDPKDAISITNEQ